MEDDLNFYETCYTRVTESKGKTTLISVEMEDNLNLFLYERLPQFVSLNGI